MRVVIGSDHAGFDLKETIKALLERLEVPYEDVGAGSPAPSDYPDFADAAARAILTGRADRGILVCGTGIGMVIAANKVPGIRAAQTNDTFSAERAAKSNNAHIITLGARVIGPELAKTIVNAWLASDFDPQGASAGNVAAIDELDRKYHQ